MAPFYLTFAFAVAFLGIAILLGFLIFYQRKLSRSRGALQGLAARLHGRITRKSMFAGDILEGLHGAIPFSCRYFMGSRNSPPSLTILANTPCPAALTIRRQAWYDRFARRIGLVGEFQTGDPLFDKAYFFDTDRDDIFMPFLSEASWRQQIDALYGLGFPVREIAFGRKDLRIVLSPLQGDAIAAVPVEKYLDGLLNLSAEIPSSGYAALYSPPLASAHRRSPLPRSGLAFIFILLGLLTAGGAVAIGFGMSRYEPLGNRLIQEALVLSAPAALVFLSIVFRWIRGRSSSHRAFLFVLIFSVVGVPLAFTGGAVVTNGYLDQGIGTSRDVPVVDRSCTRNKNTHTCYISFPSWQRSGEIDRLSVPLEFFRAVRRGDNIIIRTKPGYWQEEWIAGIERVATISSRSDESGEVPLRLQGVRFYEGPATNVPGNERRFAAQFARKASRFIWCQVDMESSLWQDRDRRYIFGWQYLNPDGSLRGELSLPFTVRREWQTAWVSHSWGWDEPGHWLPGDYRVLVFVDGRPLGEGTFTIR
ncbi:MAG: hypothetical protein MUF26_05475 [Syntrophales bacterium]|jgi:hypothetical protein|nr:hypothetical protein [Syntrophales bacterium]